MKIMDTKRFLDSLTPCFQEGRSIVIPVRGLSMAPFLKERRDRVEISPYSSQEEPAMGDIILFLRPNGQYILHRIIRKEQGQFIARGDNGRYEDQVDPSAVLGKVTQVWKNGTSLSPRSLSWKFYQNVYSRSNVVRTVCAGLAQIGRKLLGRKTSLPPEAS